MYGWETGREVPVIQRTECWVPPRAAKNVHRHSLRMVCENADYLGLKYLVQKERTVFERVLWAVFLVLSLILCQILILKGWSRWRWSTIMTRNSITDLSFPAITICPEAKFNADEISYKELKNAVEMQELSEENMTLIAALSLVCPHQFIFLQESFVYKHPSNLTHVLEKHAIQANQFILQLAWSHLLYSRDMKGIITEEGLCFTFNSLPGSQIFRENTFHASRKYFDMDVKAEKNHAEKLHNSYPLKIMGPSRTAGLWIMLKTSQKEENICRLNNGFMITAHNPADVPRPSQRGVRVPQGSVGEIVITPESFTTSNGLKEKYTPSERKCLYPDERYLQFFKTYTQVNCEIECLANYTLRLCGCVGFYMPRILTTEICSLHSSPCMASAEYIMRQIDANRDVNAKIKEETFEMNEKEFIEMKCDCLQECDRLDYKARVSHVPLIPTYGTQILNYGDTGGRGNIIVVYFDDSYYVPVRRTELYGTVEFIANCGGILGFMMGLSLLSLVEFLCCLLLRPSFFKNVGRQHRSLQWLPTVRHVTTVRQQP